MAGYFWAKWRVRPAPACRSTCHINSHPPYLAWTGLADSLQWPPSVKEDGLYFEMREKDIFCSAHRAAGGGPGDGRRARREGVGDSESEGRPAAIVITVGSEGDVLKS